jgi:pimeloyl-ACP methyl ester carboxylesterase
VLHDFRGQLRSGKPGRYTLQQHVDDVRALLDLLGIERADVAGTSYGGEIGMLFAIAHPERVRRLIVIACVSEADDALRAKVRRWIDVARHHPPRLYDATVHDNFSEAFLDGRADVVRLLNDDGVTEVSSVEASDLHHQ